MRSENPLSRNFELRFAKLINPPLLQIEKLHDRSCRVDICSTCLRSWTLERNVKEEFSTTIHPSQWSSTRISLRSLNNRSRLRTKDTRERERKRGTEGAERERERGGGIASGNLASIITTIARMRGNSRGGAGGILRGRQEAGGSR